MGSVTFIDSSGSHRREHKERTVTLNYEVCKALKAWLKIRPNVDSNSLFVSKLLEPMSPRAYDYIVKKYVKRAGIRGDEQRASGTCAIGLHETTWMRGEVYSGEAGSG